MKKLHLLLSIVFISFTACSTVKIDLKQESNCTDEHGFIEGDTLKKSAPLRCLEPKNTQSKKQKLPLDN